MMETEPILLLQTFIFTKKNNLNLYEANKKNKYGEYLIKIIA